MFNRDLGGKARIAAPLTPAAEELVEKFVRGQLEITDEELKKLASDRAEIVQRELQARGIDPQRLSATAAETPGGGENPAVHIEIASSFSLRRLLSGSVLAPRSLNAFGLDEFSEWREVRYVL